MTTRVLWPRHFGRDHDIEIEALGEGFQAEFCAGFEQVSEDQWRNCEAIVGEPLPEEYIGMLDTCRIAVKTSVGFDDVDLKRWGELGIPVCNTPDYGPREVADHAIALMMTLVKGIAFHDESLRADPRSNWRPALNPYGRRLSDCTFGVIGLGRIGTAAARRAAAFDMDVTFFDPYIPDGMELALNFHRARSLHELMGESDIVSVHTPLTDETRNLLNRDVFAVAKPGIIVINSARGGIIDIGALRDAMRSDIVLAAGLDVLPDEPPNLDEPLLAAWQANEAWIKHRLVVTPHSAYFTPESMRDIRAFSARTVARYLRDGQLENCVNARYLRHRR